MIQQFASKIDKNLPARDNKSPERDNNWPARNNNLPETDRIFLKF